MQEMKYALLFLFFCCVIKSSVQQSGCCVGRECIEDFIYVEDNVYDNTGGFRGCSCCTKRSPRTGQRMCHNKTHCYWA